MKYEEVAAMVENMKCQKKPTRDKCSIDAAPFGIERKRCSECEKDHIIAELEARNKPLKVLYKCRNFKVIWMCPVCGTEQSETMFNNADETKTGGKYSFCWACGQKLDWDVEEYKED